MKIEQLERLEKLVDDKKIFKLLLEQPNEEIDDYLDYIYTLKDCGFCNPDRFYESLELAISKKCVHLINNINLILNRNTKEIAILVENFSDNIEAWMYIYHEKLLEKRTNEELIELIKCLSRNMYKEDLIIDEDILENRTFEEQMDLINICNVESSPHVYEIIKNKSVLENRNMDDQMKLIDIYVESNYHPSIFKLITENLLIFRTGEEQICLIEKYIKSNYNLYVYECINNKKVLQHRTFEEQKSLINLCNDFNDYYYQELIYESIINEDILKKRTLFEQIELIKLIHKTNGHIMISNCVTNKTLLTTKTNEEQVRLIDLCRESVYDIDVFNIITNSDIIVNNNVDTIETLIKKLTIAKNIGSDAKEKMLLAIQNKDLLSYRTDWDHIKLLELLIESNFNPTVFSCITNPNLIRKRSNKEQLELIYKYMKCKNEKVGAIINYPYFTDMIFIYQIQLIEIFEEKNYDDGVYEIIFSKLPYIEKIEKINSLYKTVSEELEEMRSLKEVISLLKENNISEFNENTLIKVKENKPTEK